MKIWEESSVALLDGTNFFLNVNFQNSELSLFGFSDGSTFMFKSFDLKKASTFLPNKWNSFCLAYNDSAKDIKIVINGLTLVDELGAPGNISMSKVILGKSFSASGFITELNIWSKTLSIGDILKFSAGNHSDLFESIKPDILSWSKANITKQNNCTDVERINAENIFLHNELLHEQEYLLFGPIRSIEVALKTCLGMNGKVFYPRQTEELDYIRKVKKQIDSDACKYRLWTPFQRRPGHSESWTLIQKRVVPQKADLGGWKVDQSGNGSCLIFNAHSKLFQQTECVQSDQSSCVICQLEPDRLVFDFQLECDTKMDKMDTRYILWQEQPNHYSLYGSKGLNHVSMEQYSDYNIFSIGNFPGKHLANAANATLTQEGHLSTPFGIKKWKSDICPNEKESYIKLTNVSTKH